MSKVCMRRYLVALVLLLMINGNAWSMEKIGLFDLRYTLKIDAKKPEQVNMAWDHCHAVATLQGIVNRGKPLLYLIFVDSQTQPGVNIDQFWLDMYCKQGQWLCGREFIKYKSIEELINAYHTFIKGAVVYDPNVPATSNVASTAAGVEDLIAIRYDRSSESLYSRLILNGPKLPVRIWLVNPDGTSKFRGRGVIPDSDRSSTGSAKCDAYLWMKQRYMDTGRSNCLYGAYYIDYFWSRKPQATVLNHHTLTNHDFFVSKRAFFFDLSPWADEPATDDPCQIAGTDRTTLMEILLSAYKQTGRDKIIHIGGFPSWAFKYTKHAGGVHEDVQTEWEYAAIISAYNAFQDADAIGFGTMANASFWAYFPLREEYPQKWVSHEELKNKGYLTADGKVNFDGRDFIIFYVGDYDSASWLYQRMPDIWNDPNRGKVSMMWGISPVLDRRVPMTMDYLRATATDSDYFVAADNGAGYLNPGGLQQGFRSQDPRSISNLPSGLDAWEKHCSYYYKKWGLSITGFIIDGYGAEMTKDTLECYRKFSPNGIVPQKVPLTFLYKDMPMLRSDWDVQDELPKVAAETIIERIKVRPIPFHWFRNILKTPNWYVEVDRQIKKLNPKVELLDAPTFFELYRIWLKDNPDAANGKIMLPSWDRGYERSDGKK